MSQTAWSDVDSYIVERLLGEEKALFETILAANAGRACPLSMFRRRKGNF